MIRLLIITVHGRFNIEAGTAKRKLFQHQMMKNIHLSIIDDRYLPN